MGELCRSLNERIYEHTIPLKEGSINNGLDKHFLETNRSINFIDSQMLVYIICLDYVRRTSIDKIRENGFELTKKRKESDGIPQKQLPTLTTLMT